MSETNKHPVPKLLDHLGMPSVTPADSFSVTYNDGLLIASVKRQDGKVETVTRTVGNSGFSESSIFDPNMMTEEKRNELIKKQYKNGKGKTQTEIAKQFGLTQSRISRIIGS